MFLKVWSKCWWWCWLDIGYWLSVPEAQTQGKRYDFFLIPWNSLVSMEVKFSRILLKSVKINIIKCFEEEMVIFYYCWDSIFTMVLLHILHILSLTLRLRYLEVWSCIWAFADWLAMCFASWFFSVYSSDTAFLQVTLGWMIVRWWEKVVHLRMTC